MRIRLFFISNIYLFHACNAQTPQFTTQQMSGVITKDSLVNISNKYNIPQAASYVHGNLYGSFTRNVKPPSHPAVSFSQSGLLNTFLNNIVKDDNNFFLTYFAKLHLITLHQLYLYLTKIYTTFNLTHIDTIWAYLDNEETQELNKKTLIINHLVNIIEEQINQKVLSYWPSLPQAIATRASAVLLNNDYGSSLQLLLDGREDAIFKAMLADPTIDPTLTDQINGLKGQVKTMRDDYIGHYADYLKLFNAYTSPLYSNGTINIASFIQDAQAIQAQIKRPVGPQSGAAIKDQVTLLRSMEKINPPLFFYDAQTMRGLKLIPALAQQFPSTVQSVPWPATIVEAAQSGSLMKSKTGTVLSSNPIAFYANAQGESTGSSPGPRLFANIFSVNGGNVSYIYQQELLPQPQWLNSTKGIMYMLRAVLGDFASLLDSVFAGESILDPCLTCILQDAAIKAGLASSSASVCSQCQAYLDQLDQIAQSNLPAPSVSTGTPSTGISPVPSGSSTVPGFGPTSGMPPGFGPT